MRLPFRLWLLILGLVVMGIALIGCTSDSEAFGVPEGAVSVSSPRGDLSFALSIVAETLRPSSYSFDRHPGSHLENAVGSATHVWTLPPTDQPDGPPQATFEAAPLALPWNQELSSRWPRMPKHVVSAFSFGATRAALITQ